MTTKEYLKLSHKAPDPKYNKYRGWKRDIEKIREFNKELLQKYPWLTPTNDWSGKKITDCTGPDGEEGYWPGCPDKHPDYNYEYTWLDDMPDGWRIAFGDQMVEEIHQELVKYNFVNDYKITQVKEKWGGLRWYDNGTPIGKLSDEYEEINWKPSEHEGKWSPDYDRETEVLKDVGVEHYISCFDREDSGLSDEEIEKYNRNAIYHYRIYKIVEKCRIHDIISNYENLSFKVCINCGKPAEWMSKGWISPYCTECAKNDFSVDDVEKHDVEYFFTKIENI